MKISILIPHYAVGKITAYSISQILKYKEDNDVDIVVVDNKRSDGSYKYLTPFMDQITYAVYPEGSLQSHGIAMSWAIELGLVKGEYFMTMENDSFPTRPFLDYYKNIIVQGYDAAGSVLTLSSGSYLHGCGSLYRKSVYEEAKESISKINYTYFPNMAMKSGFASHLMIHNSIVADVLSCPDDWVELADGYVGLSPEEMLSKAYYYSATNNPFHCGMGGLSEDVRTYGGRCAETDAPHILIENGRKIIYRVGYEPSQYLYYFMMARSKRIFEIPIETKWMAERDMQQQEYSINEAGIKHLWAISSYTERGSKDVEDIYEAKRSIPDILYDSLPENQKV